MKIIVSMKTVGLLTYLLTQCQWRNDGVAVAYSDGGRAPNKREGYFQSKGAPIWESNGWVTPLLKVTVLLCDAL